MGTDFYEKDGIKATCFWGGDKRGVCIQITTSEGYVQLTKAQAVEICKKILEFLKKKVRA